MDQDLSQFVTAMTLAINAQNGRSNPPKLISARRMMQQTPESWFREATIDGRDRALINASEVSWIDYGPGSFLRKLYHMKKGESIFGHTDWIVEQDVTCKKMVAEAGGKLIGFDLDLSNPTEWLSMKINVNISGTPTAGFDWGFLSTLPSKARIFRGPPDTCGRHPWDAMILRDCSTNTDNITSINSIGSRYWDILLVKMCEDYDSPWVVMAVKDAGPYVPSDHCQCFRC